MGGVKHTTTWTMDQRFFGIFSGRREHDLGVPAMLLMAFLIWLESRRGGNDSVRLFLLEITEYTGMSPRAVSKAISTCVEAGVLEYEPGNKGTRGKFNLPAPGPGTD